MKVEKTKFGELLRFEVNDEIEQIISAIVYGEVNGIIIEDNLPDYRISIEDINFLTLFKQLKILIINCLTIRNYSIIENLDSLEKLMITSYSPNPNHTRTPFNLTKFENLKILELYGFGEILNIEKCYSLEFITIEPNCNSDLFFLEKLKKLNSIKLCENERKFLIKLDGIENAFNLEKLELIGCSNLKEIKKLNGLKELKHLKLENCKRIEDLNELVDLPSLEKIELLIKFQKFYAKLKREKILAVNKW